MMFGPDRQGTGGTMSVRWGLVVEEVRGTDHTSYRAEVLEDFTGSREDAMGRLEARARAYVPVYPFSHRRTRLYRTGDGFLLVSEGATTRSYGCRFSLAELLRDSEDAKKAAAAERDAERRERAEQKAAEKEAKRARKADKWADRWS